MTLYPVPLNAAQIFSNRDHEGYSLRSNPSLSSEAAPRRLHHESSNSRIAVSSRFTSPRVFETSFEGAAAGATISIAGAKKKLDVEMSAPVAEVAAPIAAAAPSKDVSKALGDVKRELNAILELLDS